jgi:hypothetical protein
MEGVERGGGLVSLSPAKDHALDVKHAILTLRISEFTEKYRLSKQLQLWPDETLY